MSRCIVEFLLVGIINSCTSQNCNSLPVFTSYNQAVNIIKKSSFTFSENLNTSKSSWITGASFYSCDKLTGFLIIETQSSNYIHKGVPIAIWNEFKTATSFGAYYDSHIKGRFRLRI